MPGNENIGTMYGSSVLSTSIFDMVGEQAIAEQRVETARPVVTAPAPLLGEDPGSLEQFRRVFATWDFRNGA